MANLSKWTYTKEVQGLFLKDPSSEIVKADQNWPKLHK